MKHFAFFLLLAVCPQIVSAINPDEWQFRQSVEITSSGLVAIKLPTETLNNAREDLADLRIIDAAGTEVPYLIDQGVPTPALTLRPKEFRAEIAPPATHVFITTGADAPIVAITFDVPAGAPFTKAVKVEGSQDQTTWQTLAAGDPIYRTAAGETNLRVPVRESNWKFLRATIDDSRSEPIPFRGAELIVAESHPPSEEILTTIRSRDENPDVTRLTLDLGAANLRLASLQFETGEALLNRHVTIAVPALSGDKLEEQTVTTGIIYRVDTAGARDSRLEVPINKLIKTRELIVSIANGDSPPLAISALKVTRRITRLRFFGAQPGTFTLLSGNSQCAAPQYDDLKQKLQGASETEGVVSRPAVNPNYQVTLPQISGARIDILDWKYRKQLQLTTPGPQQAELDVDALAGSATDLRDLRIVQGDLQLPFILHPTSALRSFAPVVTTQPDHDHPNSSRWQIKLPQRGIPVVRLTCASSSALFERHMRVWEEPFDERGEKYAHELGEAQWRYIASDKAAHDLSLELQDRPLTGTLLLETDNGANAAIELHDVRAYYKAISLILDAPATVDIWLYYGNDQATTPHYDAQLIANRLLRAQRATASLGAEEKLKGERVMDTLAGSGRYILWVVLALVVVTVLILVSRLLPKSGAGDQ